MLEIKDFGMFGQGRTFEVNVRFGRTEQFGLKMAELFGRTECSFEHYPSKTEFFLRSGFASKAQHEKNFLTFEQHLHS